MKSPFAKLLLLNIIIGIALIGIFYFAAFLSGYASNLKYLPTEKHLFFKFVIFHFVANILLLYRIEQINSAGIATSILTICLIYSFILHRVYLKHR